jgi:hypothetical protein
VAAGAASIGEESGVLGTPYGLSASRKVKSLTVSIWRFLRFANKVFTQPTGLLANCIGKPRI